MRFVVRADEKLTAFLELEARRKSGDLLTIAPDRTRIARCIVSLNGSPSLVSLVSKSTEPGISLNGKSGARECAERIEK
jgi:hypothetical protein